VAQKGQVENIDLFCLPAYAKKTGQNVRFARIFATLYHSSCFKHMNKLIFTCLVVAVLAGCKSDSKFDANLLIGNWKGAAWVVAGKATDRDAHSVAFSFETNAVPAGKTNSRELLEAGMYTAAYGAQLEKGDFKVKGDKLYTTAEDKVEKVVRIVTLTADSLVLGMNRVGQEETLVLLKSQ
jgi:Lipocalin-like domain